MKHEHFVVQSPATPAAQLILLFHGVGDNPVAMGGDRQLLRQRLSSGTGGEHRWPPKRSATAPGASGFRCRM